jgi:DNA-binding CsgD family transcriptional regulator
MEAFAERARIELAATGEKVRKRTVETGELTAQELQVARMALDGLSNPGIGGRLFISPRTVKYHLRKVFTKLDINSRSELKRVMSSGAIFSPAPPDWPLALSPGGCEHGPPRANSPPCHQRCSTPSTLGGDP